MKLDTFTKPENKMELTTDQELKTSNDVNVLSNDSKLDEDTKAFEGAIKETDIKQEEKAIQQKHLITFIGNGVWIDNKGVAWSKTKDSEIISEMIMSDIEIADRDDIRFMISYGAMKETIV